MTIRLSSPREFMHTLERKYNISTILNNSSYDYYWYKMRSLCNLFGINGLFNIHDIVNDDHYSEEITKLYQYIVENEEELILWRLL